MKKKLMIALFAVMSAASMQAYSIEIINRSTVSVIDVIIKGVLAKRVMAGRTVRTKNYTDPIDKVGVKAYGPWAPTQSFTIPQAMRGKNIVMKVTRGRPTKAGLTFNASFVLKK